MSDRTHPRIDAFRDGELAGDEAARAAEHVAGCAECRMALAAARAFAEALAGPAAALPPAFAVATRERALGRRLPQPPLWWLALPAPWWTGIAALILLAALAGTRLGGIVAADRSAAAELGASLDAPATDAMLALPGAEARR